MGTLPSGILAGISSKRAAHVTGAANGLNVTFGTTKDGNLFMGNGALDMLVSVVVGARCNAAEFGRTYVDAVPKAGSMSKP